jgi:hypothetical protein
MEEIFNKLLKVGLSPNQLYLLHCRKNAIIPAFLMNQTVEEMRLKSEGWLSEDGRLTDNSLIILKDINSFFKASKTKTSTDIMGENFLKKIEEYLEIFPKFKLPSGKYARSDKKNLENSFRWFFENHTYDWNTVLEATKMYVDEYERTGYKYMRTSQYFIRKQNAAEKSFESELANYCEVYLNGSGENNDYVFKEKVV